MKALLALRRAEDLEPVKEFVERLGIEVVPLTLGISQWVDEKLVRFRGEGDLGYHGEGLPAEVFVEKAIEGGFDMIIAVSSKRKGHFSNDLASTLAVMSPLPVLVIKA